MPSPVVPRGASPLAVTALALRAVAVVSLLTAVVRLDGTDAALMALVVGGVMVPPRLRVPAGLDALYCAAVLAAAWSSVVGLYDAVAWWDVVMHVGSTAIIAAVAYWALLRLGVVPHPVEARGPGRALGVAVVTAGLGAVLSVLWEVGEWAGNAYLDPTIGVGYVDTVGDLVAGSVGSAVAGLLLVRWGARRADRAARPTAPRAA